MENQEKNLNELVHIPNENTKIINLIVKLFSLNKFNYYAELGTYMNYFESEHVKTCGVNVSGKGMNFYWNKKFIDDQTEEELLFTLIHTECHLLFDHAKRSIFYDQKITNIVQDMIINQIIHDEIIKDDKVKNLITIPKDRRQTLEKMDMLSGEKIVVNNQRYNQNLPLFIPREFGDKVQSFEVIYEWFKDEQIKFRKNRNKKYVQKDSQNRTSLINIKPNSDDDTLSLDDIMNDVVDTTSSSDGSDGSINDMLYGVENDGQITTIDYGKYGLNGVDCLSLESILELLEQDEDLSFDTHMSDEISPDARQTIVGDAQDRLKNRGFETGNVQQVLMKLIKPKHDYLKEIKRAIASDILGNVKRKSVSKLNRRGIEGIKGNKKIKCAINCILDTSGSMGGDFEAVLSYVFQNDIQINLIQIDTCVKCVENIKNKKELQAVKIEGFGGTELTPAIKFIANPANKLHMFSNVILTDGYTDTLDFSGIKQKSLILTTGTTPPLKDPRGVVKVIKINKEDSLRG